MTGPALNDFFSPLYDEFSINRSQFSIPEHFDTFLPDYINNEDFSCLSVISPSLELGARKWTNQGRWLTIGIYRDEGRDSARKPPIVGLNWNRIGPVVTIIDPSSHKLVDGERVDVYNLNVPSILNVQVTVLDAFSFRVTVPDEGDFSGLNGAYHPVRIYNFYEENLVFRLLPSFKLVPWQTIQDLFTESQPNQLSQLRSLYNVTSLAEQKIPRGKTKTANYDLPITADPVIDRLPLNRRFDQVYDERGVPLSIKYQEDGQPVSLSNYDDPDLTTDKLFNSPEYLGPNRVRVYDFYGWEINDPARGPYFSTSLITRDITKPPPLDNILRAGVNEPYYSKKIYDRFGNLVIGLQTNDQPVVRKNLLPLKFDRFNRPQKLPIRRLGKFQGFVS